jgi:hypothetical protein
MNQINYSIILKPEEEKGNYQFNKKVVMTIGFVEEVGEGSQEIASQFIADCLGLIRNEIRNENKKGSDYLRVFEINKDGDKTTFWAIDDVTHATFLMPHEY